MNLKPDEFWRLTLAEFNDLVKGYEWREKSSMQKLAWHAANVMNVHTKKKVTPKQLLGLDKPQTDEQKQTQMEKLKSQVERLKKRENKS